MYLFAFQTQRVSAPVEPFVVLRHHRPCPGQKIDIAYYSQTRIDVSAHFLPFVLGQRALLEQDRIAYSDLSDIVEKSSLFKSKQFDLIKAQLKSESQAVSNNPIRMASSFAVARFKSLGKGPQGSTIVDVQHFKRLVEPLIQ